MMGQPVRSTTGARVSGYGRGRARHARTPEDRQPLCEAACIPEESTAATAARRQTQGNPLAAGLIAFGVGWLVSSLLPDSQKERELAHQLKDRA